MAENVIQTDYDRASILAGIHNAQAYDQSPIKNPYGSGQACERIIAHMRQILTSHSREQILRKVFVNTNI